MPKKFEFTGLRKYDPTATVQEKEYSEGIDYSGADTQVFLRDTGKDKPDVRINCFRNLSGGKLFRDMRDTSCYGQSHKSYMPGQDDSEPVDVTISALSEKALELCFTAWKNKKTIWMTIIYPDGRYIRGLVRIESIDFDTPIDSVFQYIVTFRRVSDQEIGTGLFYVIYELRDCKWVDETTEAEFTKRAFYTKSETVKIPKPSAFKGPFDDVGVNIVDVYNTLTGQLISPTGQDNTITIESNVRVVPRYSASKIDLVVVWNKEGLSIGRTVSTTTRFNVGDSYTLPTKEAAESEAQLTGYGLTGWMINGDETKVKAPGDTITITADLQKIVAKWGKVYKLTYSDGGHTTKTLPEGDVYFAGEEVILSDEVPKYAGGNNQYWIFDKWVDTDNGEPYQPGDTITIPQLRGVNLTAQWKAQYKIIYDCNDATEGGPGPSDGGLYDDGVSVTLKDGPRLKKGNQVFGGWLRDGDSKTVYNAGGSYTVKSTNNSNDHNITFHVKWVDPTPPGIDEEPEEPEETV